MTRTSRKRPVGQSQARDQMLYFFEWGPDGLIGCDLYLPPSTKPWLIHLPVPCPDFGIARVNGFPPGKDPQALVDAVRTLRRQSVDRSKRQLKRSR